MSDIETIKNMLSFRRPAGSKTEALFIERFLHPLGVKKDQFGNHHLTIGEKPDVLWSSHTDSVHHKEGFQRVVVEGDYIKLPEKSKSNCLGADCAAGVWIMIEMIKAKLPGLYLFHAAEEIGCVGSKAILHETPEVLDGIKMAIAFDRRKTGSVITHQGSRCCSDAFGESMIKQLPSRFKLDPTGFVTDTKVYMKTIPECTNISVGYYDEHHPEERLDFAHLIELRDHMIKIDTTQLVIERDPKAVPAQPKVYPSGHDAIFGLFSRRRHPENIYDLVYNYPRLISDFLENECLVQFAELHEYVQEMRQPVLPGLDDGDDGQSSFAA